MQHNFFLICLIHLKHKLLNVMILTARVKPNKQYFILCRYTAIWDFILMRCKKNTKLYIWRNSSLCNMYLENLVCLWWYLNNRIKDIMQHTYRHSILFLRIFYKCLLVTIFSYNENITHHNFKALSLSMILRLKHIPFD